MKIKCVKNIQYNPTGYKPFLVSKEITEEVKVYHESIKEYSETSLISLDRLATQLGVSKIYVKDESSRFQLNSFKVLGAAYAVGKALANKLNTDINNLPFNVMKKRVKEELRDIKLMATTDGNHGRGVAWMGRQLGLEVHIYMPKGTTKNRLNHVLDQGANGTITEMNYDDTVRWVAEEAKKKDMLVIQDTAWEGYEDVPLWIMQGYSTMAREVLNQLGDEIPTHVVLQAGVGAFAGVMAEVLYTHYQESCPKIILVEAESADCFYQSAIEGKKIIRSGDLTTIMAGLACGEPNPIAYNVLFSLVDSFVSTPDWVAANGMRILASPLQEDQKIISGESGAVSVGMIESILSDDQYTDIKEILGLHKESRVLVFSTEGDTDKTIYQDVVWHGKFPKEVY